MSRVSVGVLFCGLWLCVPNSSADPFTVDGSTLYVSGGQVGIGTAAPQAVLEVNGSAMVDGVLTLSTNSAVNVPWGSTAQRPASPSTGTFRFNTTLGAMEFFDGSNWQKITATVSAQCSGTGGVITLVGGQCIHTFTTSGSFTAPTSTNAAILVVSGGGGASQGGGGAGGVLYNPSFPITGTMTVTIGAGGVGQDGNGTQGSASSFGSTSTVGGGYGGWGGTGGSGGSGGGGGTGVTGGSATGPGYVNIGGAGVNSNPYPCGGGGGAGAAGGSGSGSTAGNGGAGIAIAISGSVAYYGGGGAGSLFNSGTNGTGASGGGGNVGTDGAANTGGGGGACTIGGTPPCGNGGSGVVIVSYTAQ